MVQVPNLEDRRSDFDNSQACEFPNFHDFCFFTTHFLALQWFLCTPSITKSVQRIQGSKSIKCCRFSQIWLKLSASRILVVHHKGFVKILSSGGIICFEMIQIHLHIIIEPSCQVLVLCVYFPSKQSRIILILFCGLFVLFAFASEIPHNSFLFKVFASGILQNDSP